MTTRDQLAQTKQYLIARRSVIQHRLVDTFRFVELGKDNGHTFSYEFASILRDAGSAFGSVMDSLVRLASAEENKGKLGRKTKFEDYREWLTAHYVAIERLSVQVRALHPAGLVLPFSSLREEQDPPAWWSAYNKVKHSEYKHFSRGNLENAVLSVAALVLLERVLEVQELQLGDAFWVNIGIVYDEAAIDMSEARVLFRA